MENASKYELIHIDTLDSVMCEKYTFGGHDYYMKENYKIYAGAAEHLYHIMLNSVATNNPDSGCPQMVDYVEYLAELHSSDVWGMHVDVIDIDSNGTRGDNSIKDYKVGYQKHSETHSLSDEEVIKFVSNVDFKGGILTPKELLEIFKSTLPIKVYYK